MRGAVVRLSLVVLVVGPAALVLTASPCAACSCVPQTPKELYRGADAAFVGSVIDQQAIDQTTTVQTFAVRSVVKGPLGATVHVIDPIGSSGGDTCGILYGAGEVAVILHRQGDGWTTDVCSRITVAQLMSVGPTPVHPSPEPSGPPAGTGPPPGAGQGSGGPGWPAVVLGLLLGVAAIAAALSLGGRRDHGRGPPLPEPEEHAAEGQGPAAPPSG